MVDAKRKGQLKYCKKCGKKTRHIAETDKKEKLVFWYCNICGDAQLQDNWS